jgi:hypothetical protein
LLRLNRAAIAGELFARIARHCADACLRRDDRLVVAAVQTTNGNKQKNKSDPTLYFGNKVLLCFR